MLTSPISAENVTRYLELIVRTEHRSGSDRSLVVDNARLWIMCPAASEHDLLAATSTRFVRFERIASDGAAVVADELL